MLLSLRGADVELREQYGKCFGELGAIDPGKYVSGCACIGKKRVCPPSLLHRPVTDCLRMRKISGYFSRKTFHNTECLSEYKYTDKEYTDKEFKNRIRVWCGLSI